MFFVRLLNCFFFLCCSSRTETESWSKNCEIDSKKLDRRFECCRRYFTLHTIVMKNSLIGLHCDLYEFPSVKYFQVLSCSMRFVHHFIRNMNCVYSVYVQCTHRFSYSILRNLESAEVFKKNIHNFPMLFIQLLFFGNFEQKI